MSASSWTLIDRAPNAAIAQAWADYLQRNGVPCFVEGAMLSDERAAAMQAIGMLGVDLKTSADRVEEARRLLTALKARGAERPTVDCPKCGEPIEGAFDACWKCGTERPDAEG
jgi:hypothetical protein